MNIKYIVPFLYFASISSVQAQVTDISELSTDLFKASDKDLEVLTESSWHQTSYTNLPKFIQTVEITQLPSQAEEQNQAQGETESLDPHTTNLSPLYISPSNVPTAEQLPAGAGVINIRNRIFSPPGEEETGLYPILGLSWGITDQLQITIAGQGVDSGAPGSQGDFNVIRSENGEATLELKHRLWDNPEQNLALSGVFSISGGSREFTFRGGGETTIISANDIIPAFQFPLTYFNNRASVTLSPTIAFFPEDHAMFLHRPPIANPGSFGTNFGLSGAASYQLNPRLTLWGDAFIPFIGNNSLDEDSGKPAKAVALDVGLRYFVNPRVALDLFTSNRIGSVGPLALTAESQGNFGVGFGLAFMPNLFAPANKNYPDSFLDADVVTDNFLPGGLNYFDGGVLPQGTVAVDILGGSQGISSALRYGLVNDLEAGIYLNYAFGNVDESEQGFGIKARLLNQQTGSPITASMVATLGLTNETFVNFRRNDAGAFERGNVEKKLPFFLNGDVDERSLLYLTTLSFPLQYQFENDANIWLTPMLGYAQRLGFEMAGFNLGGSYPIAKELSLIGEVGANFIGEGNMLGSQVRENAIPWTVAMRWQPTNFLGTDFSKSNYNPYFNLFVTNRVGFSPWQQMRVQHENNIAVGLGLTIPFNF